MHFASFDGMLFSKDLSKLLSVPEGKEGVAVIPQNTTAVPTGAFSHSALVTGVACGEGGIAYSSENGLLYSKDMKTLIVCPPKSSDSIVIPEATESISSDAFTGNTSLASIVVRGAITSIDPTAFDEKVKKTAVVALASGASFEEHKAVWKAAGFERFVEPAKPGETTQPEESASGFTYTLLDDFTLEVAWQGSDDPATDLVIPASAELDGVPYRVSRIAGGAFAGRAALESVSVPSSVVSIGAGAFLGCVSLAAITLSEGIAFLENSAFAATALNAIVLPSSVVSIGARVFAECESLTRIVCLGEIDYVDEEALVACSNVDMWYPLNLERTHPWSMGFVALDNHISLYGFDAPVDAVNVSVGSSVELFGAESMEVPEGALLTFSYPAQCVSIDQAGMVTGKAQGSLEVAASIMLDDVVLANTSRTIEVTEPLGQTKPHEQPQDLTAFMEKAKLPLVGGRYSSTYAPRTNAETFEAVAPSGQTLKYTVDSQEGDRGEVTVSKSETQSSLPSGELIIPGNVEHNETIYHVRRVQDQGFSECSGLTSVVIPDGVETIGRQAFANNSSLVKVTLGLEICALPTQAFAGCNALREIYVKAQVSSIDDIAFSGIATSNVKVYPRVGVGVSEWTRLSFSLQSEPQLHLVTFSLSGGTINSSLLIESGKTVPRPPDPEKHGNTFTGWFADRAFTTPWDFENTTISQDTTIYASFSESSEGTFYKNSGDKELHYRILTEGTVDSPGTVRVIRNDKHSDPALLSGELIIPQTVLNDGVIYSVSEIGSSADISVTQVFAGCSSLTSVVIPSSVTNIGLNAFCDAINLSNVTFEPGSSLEAIGSGSFARTKLTSITIPNSVKSLGVSSFLSCQNLNSVEFTEDSKLQSIARSCFAWTPLSSIDLPDTVRSIGDDAFSFTALKAISIPDNVEVIRARAFRVCGALETVTFGKNSKLRVIEDEAFTDSGIQEITLPTSVSTIGIAAFNNCPNLASVNITPDSALSSIGLNAFRNTAIKSIALPVSLTSIGTNAFANCPQLAVVSAQSSLAGVDVATAFDATSKANAKVYLPPISTDGKNEPFSSMKAAWATCGFAEGNILSKEGALPTVNSPSNTDVSRASWLLDADGTLIIKSTEAIADFAWLKGAPESIAQHWGPMRAFVRAVDTSQLSDTPSMACWFSDMPSLTDVTKVTIPSGVKSLSNLFSDSSAITAIPEELNIPEGVVDASDMFNTCTALTTLPAGFRLPSTLTNAGGLFCRSGLITLPEGFTVGSATNLRAMFFSCENLTSLPASFIIPEGAQVNMNAMFMGCVKLSSLPDGFRIPDSVVGMNTFKPLDQMFSNCPSLTSLPASFDFPVDIMSTADRPFACEIPEGSPRITTHYAGTSEAVLNFDWASQGRTLVTSSEDRGQHEVTFKVQAPTEPFAWETRSKSLTSTSGIAANPGTPTLTGYTFTGWSTDEEGLRPFDFATKLTSATTLYGKWIKHGGRHTLEGQLPTKTPDGIPGFDAWWYITADGTLFIGTDNTDSTIQSFGWKENVVSVGYWSNYRTEVKKAVMVSGLRGGETIRWFGDMPNLTDVSHVYIPNGVVDASAMFDGATNLTTLPENFTIPDSVTQLNATFRTCDLRKLPDRFRISANTLSVHSMFANNKNLTSLPEGCVIPEKTVYIGNYLSRCQSLKTLPSQFKIPAATQHADTTFRGCLALESLPEGFGFEAPQNFKNVDRMFTDCPKLTSLPASLKLNDLSQEAKEGTKDHPGWDNMFGFAGYTPPTTIETYYAGDLSNMPTNEEFWSKQNRSLVTSVPAGRYTASYYLPDAATGNYGGVWTKALSDDEGILTELSAPTRINSEFLGWYTDEACTTKFDFTKPITADVSLYGKYLAMSGTLPTTDGEQNASWSVSRDGTLRIDCEAGASIAGLDFHNETNRQTKYWGPLRSMVKRAEMAPTVMTSTMNRWFSFMPALTDVSGVFLPEGIQNIAGLFQTTPLLKSIPDSITVPATVKEVSAMFESSGITTLPAGFSLPPSVMYTGYMFSFARSLESLPSGFTIPTSTTDFTAMFQHCSSLVSLPDGVALPAGATNLLRMFRGCTSLASLPTSFTIPSGVTNTEQMFDDCLVLASLPAGFTIPLSTTSISQMFNNCFNLASLPEGFSIPQDIRLDPATNMNNMFNNCISLKTLPDSFDFPQAVAEASTNPFKCNSMTTTYYGGTSEAVKTYDWTTQNRTLYTQENPPTDAKVVSFMLTKDGGATTEKWRTVLTKSDGTITDPGPVGQFGYSLSGWYKDPACTQPFDFSAPVTESCEVYGSLSLVIDYDVPLSAKISIDAMGKATPAPAKLKSYTPAKLKVNNIKCTRAPSADEVMDEATLNGLAVSLLPAGATWPLYIPLGKEGTAGFTIDSATGVSSPGVLDFSIGLGLPPNAVIKYYQEGWTTDLARLEYTVGLG